LRAGSTQEAMDYNQVYAKLAMVIWGNGKVESRKETDQSHFLS